MFMERRTFSIRIETITKQSSYLYSLLSYARCTDDLIIRADTNTKKRHRIRVVKIDGEGNEWIQVAEKYLVRLDPDISKCEYLDDDPDILPLGKVDGFLPEGNVRSRY